MPPGGMRLNKAKQGAKLGEGEKAKVGEGCPKVRLSQDRMPIFCRYAECRYAQRRFDKCR